MLKVYVAGKLNDTAVGYISNVHYMIWWANRLRSLDFSVFVPCLDLLMGIMDGGYTYEDYFNNSQPWLEVADAIFVVPGSEDSEGTNKEIKHAKALKIPVFYTEDDLWEWRGNNATR